ncbi:MAG: DUF6221 family protein [Micromonosporaceae bacterium]
MSDLITFRKVRDVYGQPCPRCNERVTAVGFTHVKGAVVAIYHDGNISCDLTEAEWLPFGDDGPTDGALWTLADVEAKRAILGNHADAHDCGDPRSWEWPYVGCRDVRLLAQIDRDHPDYNPAWALDG